MFKIKPVWFNRLLYACVFLVGHQLLLPVPPEGESFPFYASPLRLLGKVNIFEVLIFIHALIFHRRIGQLFSLRRFRLEHCYLLFFLLGVFSSLYAGILNDFFEAGRFLLISLYVAALRVSCKTGEACETLLLSLSLGLLSSGLINLYFTFSSPRGVLGLLPLLHGQNGPGGNAGLFLVIISYLWSDLDRNVVRVAVGVAALISLFIIILSYSKIAMLMAALAAAIFFFTLRFQRRVWIGALALVLFAAFAISDSDAVRQARSQAQIVAEYKFSSDDGPIGFDESDRQRFGYFLAVVEIVAQHPLGVSYSGFGNALAFTSTYKSGGTPEEGDLADANPHNSFLYYSASHGVLGAFACGIFLYLIFLVVRYHAKKRTVAVGARLILFIFALILFGNTLPSLINSHIVPLALCMFSGGLGLPRTPPVSNRC